MDKSVVEETLKQILRNRSLDGVDFLWLTGEPLVMGLKHFEEVVGICEQMSPFQQPPQFIIQTNGTLINQEWCDFFAKHRFVVGVSIDGPPEIHDAQRRTKGGKGTFSDALNGIKLLIQNKIKGGAIAVITRNTLTVSPDDLFHFFHSRGIAWSYLIEARIGENSASTTSVGIEDARDIERYLDRLLELWAEHPESYIRDFEQTARRIYGGSRPEHGDDNLGCLDILNVAADRTFYWGNPELMSATTGKLSSIRFSLDSTDVWKCRSTGEFRNYQRQVHAGVIKCRSECEFYGGCQGGNPAHKFYEFGRFDVSQHVSCRLNDQTVQRLMRQRLLRGTMPELVKGEHELAGT
jgi:uncharacterized protein